MFSKIPNSRIFLLLFLLLLLRPVGAQNGDSSQVADIQILARPHGRSITLRWAPTNYTAWLEMQQHGVVLERKSAGEKNWRAVHQERLLAYSLAEFEALSDTDNPHVLAVAEALYGEAESPSAPSAGPMAAVKLKREEQEQRLFLALVNADLSAEAATALGWRWVDEAVSPGIPYYYRVRSLPAAEASNSRFVSPSIRLRPNDGFPFGPVFGLEMQEDEKKIQLSWPAQPNEERYIAYFIEVSDDSIHFQRLKEYPIFKSSPQEGKDHFVHDIQLAENYQPKYYRLVGINSFAEQAPPSKAVKGQGIDKSPPKAVETLQAKDTGTGSFRVQWRLPASPAPDVRGHVLVRSQQYKGPFSPVNEQILAPTTLEYTDTQAIPYQTNYYALYTYDTAGNYAMSSPVMAIWEDQNPPAKPIGLTGRIDTLGNVFLLWEAGKEPDLHGYRVYSSHAKNREFLQVTTEILHQNYFFDSTRLDVLNEKIYYRIVALDNNFNPSEYSDILELMRPDKIPPSAPLISHYSNQADSICLHFRPSNSPDVQRQEIWRKEGEKAWQLLRLLSPQDTIFADTQVVAEQNYRYKIRAIDEAQHFADSGPLSIRATAKPSRAGVSQLSIKLVANENKWELSWQGVAADASGLQLYAAKGSEGLRPLRRLAPDVFKWSVPRALEHRFALQVIYPDGSRSPLSTIVSPPQNK